MDETTPGWVAVCEAEADFRITTTIAEREICEKLSWASDCIEGLTHDRPERLFRWRGIEAGSAFTTWTDVSCLARERGVKVHGKFGPAHEGGGYVEARKALVLVALADEPAQAVVLEKDTDGHAGRITGYETARNSARWPFPVVLALPHPEREAWVLAGFVPDGDDERARLDSERQRLGFNPCEHASKLNPGQDGAKRGTKRTLTALTGGDEDREERCWCEASLDLLRSRGAETGLAEFLDEVDERLVPLVGSGA